MRSGLIISLFAVVASSFGCGGGGFISRDAEIYRQDTRELISTQNPFIKACYDEQLENDANISGKVVVKFMVQKESGMISNPSIDESRSTAPADLAQCIIDAIEGIQLERPDSSDAFATFTWEFKVASQGLASK